MSEDFNTDNSKMSFFRESPVTGFKVFISTVLLIVIIIGGIMIWGRISAGARNALSDAKDVRVAMKLISLEYYGEKGALYDPSSENGMDKNALARILSVCPVSGEIILTGWDEEKDIPYSFSYRDGKYLVEYRQSDDSGANGTDGAWSVYYDIKVLEYKTGD